MGTNVVPANCLTGEELTTTVTDTTTADKWAPICWSGATQEMQELLGTDTCPAVLNKHGTDEYNWRKDENDKKLAPTLNTLSCDLNGPNAQMNEFWKKRHNSEWTEAGKGEVDKF